MRERRTHQGSDQPALEARSLAVVAGAQLLRTRLLGPLEANRLGVVVAGGGYGKSVLADQLRLRLGAPTVRLSLGPRDRDASLLPMAITQSLRAGRLSDLAAAVDGRPAPVAATTALVEALGTVREAVLVLVDDAHYLRGEGVAALSELYATLPTPHRLLVLSRLAVFPTGPPEPPGATGTTRLGAEELAFTPVEIEQYVFEIAGLRLSDYAISTIRRTTGGWPAAVALWASAVASSPEPEAAVEALGAQRAGLGTLIESLLSELSPAEREATCQLSHLPLLSPQVVGKATGIADLYARVEELGLPLVDCAPGWARLAAPVAEHLAAKRALDVSFADRAGQVYEDAGEDSAAIATFLVAGLAERAAALIGRLGPSRRSAVGAPAVRSFVAELPTWVLERYPEAWLRAAQGSDEDGHWADRREALELAAGAAASISGADRRRRLLHEVQAEQAYDCLREGQADEARRLAEVVIGQAQPGEHAARSRALVCAGRLAALGAVTDRDLETAARLLRNAVACARRAGEDRWTAAVLLRLVEDALREQCRYAEALDATEEALELGAGAARWRALALTSRSDTLIEMGRLDEAEAVVAESRQLGRIMHHQAVLAYAAWTEMSLAALLQDQQRLTMAVAACEERKGDWFSGFSGLGFLTDAADSFDRVGLHDAAQRYLERARLRRHQDERQFAVVEACIVARSGDPARGRELVRQALKLPGVSPRRRWRLQLLDARAAMEARDENAGPLAALAFDYCLELGWPRLPLLHEPRAVEQLLNLAAAAGSHSAEVLSQGKGRMRLRCLGDFGLARGPEKLVLPPGRPTWAVMALVATGGGMHSEELIDALWPEADLEVGRGRLRNVMSRVKAAAEGLLERQGEFIRLGRDVDVDLFDFEELGRRALELAPADPYRASTMARSAVALYRGPALRDASYESWAAPTRERARLLYLRLVDLLAADAERHEQVDEAVRLLSQAIDVEPYDEDRYARAARLLRSQGRVGSARAMVQRCRAAMAELGLETTLEGSDLLAEPA
ncbi:MAG TPA: BTAD domain-containing putative transcriptional regulator [Acidimicrobiales bacterium]|nr:BTAD domain-containing putative transcriptional regulator [Acidimicrobiales bacterium]